MHPHLSSHTVGLRLVHCMGRGGCGAVGHTEGEGMVASRTLRKGGCGGQ